MTLIQIKQHIIVSKFSHFNVHTQRTVFVNNSITRDNLLSMNVNADYTLYESSCKITLPFVVSHMVSMLVVVLPNARLWMLTTSLTNILSLLFFSFMCPPCCLVLFLFPPWPLLNPDSPNKVRNSFHLYCSQQCYRTHRAYKLSWLMTNSTDYWQTDCWTLYSITL